ncbi:GNAT family N-acetyltransferase [Micavibrio aeruginosavorus]|uniref:GNAT family N-acetyltransferase n=1 Tax=Micavibrio aeruginosavorus TaxID=349221 RepID=UPI003F4ABDBC
MKTALTRAFVPLAAPPAPHIADAHAVIASGLLPKTGEAYTIQWLNTSHIPALLTLQHLAADQEIILRDTMYFGALFATGNAALGVFNQFGMMIGAATIRNKTAPMAAFCAALETSDQTIGTHSIFGTVMTHPDYRGNGLMGRMIDQWMIHARENGTENLHARLRTTNENSLKNFLRKDFKIVAEGPSPEDATRTVYFVHRTLGPQ